MATLTLSDKTARKVYPSAIPEMKSILEETFGKSFFSERKIDRIKSLEDACRENGTDINHPKFSQGDPDDIAYQQIKEIIKALNPEGWVPDYNNKNQQKWAPWFWMDEPGFRFDGSLYGFTDTGSTGGSRLCLANKELSDYMGKQFLSLYKAWLS